MTAERKKSLVEEVAAPGMDGLAQLQALIDGGRRPGIAESLDFTLAEVGPGTAVFTGTPGQHAYNPIGTVHGGYAAALLDSCCGCAVHTKLSPTQMYTTLDLRVSYLKPIVSDTGPLRAEGKTVSVGRRAAFAEGVLKDASGKVYATATSTLLVFERT